MAYALWTADSVLVGAIQGVIAHDTQSSNGQNIKDIGRAQGNDAEDWRG
jgi:hypothetical protein